MDVYGFSLGPGQLVSYAGVWVTANDNDQHDEQGGFQIGWRVGHLLYIPVFFIKRIHLWVYMMTLIINF